MGKGGFGHFIKICLRIDLKTLVLLAPLQVDLQEHKPKRLCELLQLVKNAQFNQSPNLTYFFLSLENQGRNDFLIDINFMHSKSLL